MTGGGSGCILSNSSGQLYIAACPQGTAAFSGSAPITITGSGPYTIACATCFTTSGGTVTGATTFSAATTFQAAVTHQANDNIANGYGLYITGPSYTGELQPTASSVGTVTGELFGIFNSGTGLEVAFDHSGNIGTAGQVTATQFNISSKRSYKQDIQPLSVDALEVLRNICWSSYKYRPGHGDPTQTHIGFIADCAPSIVSGTNHDHFDVEAVATIDGVAVLELQKQICVLYGCVLTLLIITCVLGVVALAKRT
jgi:hypothetical protein